MREIKFRAWDETLLEMFCFELIDLRCEMGAVGDPLPCTYLSEETTHAMQFTGLLDSVGTELFEGDIVTGVFDGSYCTRWIIEYLDGAFQFLNFMDSSDGHFWIESIEEPLVIGNIYQNPELLEES